AAVKRGIAPDAASERPRRLDGAPQPPLRTAPAAANGRPDRLLQVAPGSPRGSGSGERAPATDYLREQYNCENRHSKQHIRLPNSIAKPDTVYWTHAHS